MHESLPYNSVNFPKWKVQVAAIEHHQLILHSDYSSACNLCSDFHHHWSILLLSLTLYEWDHKVRPLLFSGCFILYYVSEIYPCCYIRYDMNWFSLMALYRYTIWIYMKDRAILSPIEWDVHNGVFKQLNGLPDSHLKSGSMQRVGNGLKWGTG